MLKIQQVLLNENGENVLNDYFDSIIFKTNYVLVTKAHMTGIYDRTSFKQILKCEWETITFERGYIIASRISQIGVFESSGQNILHSYNWDKVKLFDEGILVTKDSKQGFFRYDGTKDEFNLDSPNPDFSLYDEFLSNQTRYSMLKTVNPENAEEMLKINKEAAIKRFEFYKSLINKDK